MTKSAEAANAPQRMYVCTLARIFIPGGVKLGVPVPIECPKNSGELV